jgi:hypothetical protein
MNRIVCAGLSLVVATVAADAQQQRGECFRVMMNPSGGNLALGSILLDQCTGKSWVLTRVNIRGVGATVRWYPITVETTEAIGHP